MTELPFQLLIKRASPGKQTESLLCTKILRVIPGRRQIYDALWNDQPVVAKVFSHKISAKRHLKREWQGLSLLQARELNSPKPLFYGQTEDGRWVAVVQRIVDSPTVLDAFNKTTGRPEKLDLLILVCKELAKQHKKGVLQRDIHLGNLLLSDGKVFALDPGQMKFFSRQVARRESISQLALLTCCVPDCDTASIARLCQEYFKAREWCFGRSDELSFQKRLTVHRERLLRRGLRKCLRTSKRYLRLKIRNSIAVFDKVFYLGAEPLDFVEQVDGLMDRGEIIKNGRTSYVSRLMWNNKDVVVKRYNHKGFIHSLRHTIKGSRARRGWLHAHRLRMLKIATPKPLAYIEKRKGLLLWQSYLVTEYVQGQNLHGFSQNDCITEQHRKRVVQQVVELLERLGKYRISHGDLKHSNILITDNGPVLTDLDAMKAHRWLWMYKARKAKDITNFAERGQLGQAVLSDTEVS